MVLMCPLCNCRGIHFSATKPTLDKFVDPEVGRGIRLVHRSEGVRADGDVPFTSAEALNKLSAEASALASLGRPPGDSSFSGRTMHPGATFMAPKRRGFSRSHSGGFVARLLPYQSRNVCLRRFMSARSPCIAFVIVLASQTSPMPLSRAPLGTGRTTRRLVPLSPMQRSVYRPNHPQAHRNLNLSVTRLSQPRTRLAQPRSDTLSGRSYPLKLLWTCPACGQRCIGTRCKRGCHIRHTDKRLAEDVAGLPHRKRRGADRSARRRPARPGGDHCQSADRRGNG